MGIRQGEVCGGNAQRGVCYLVGVLGCGGPMRHVAIEEY